MEPVNLFLLVSVKNLFILESKNHYYYHVAVDCAERRVSQHTSGPPDSRRDHRLSPLFLRPLLGNSLQTTLHLQLANYYILIDWLQSFK